MNRIGQFWRQYVQGFGLVLLILIAYRPAFSAGWIWDDDAYVSGNMTLRTNDGLRRIWFEPSASPQYYPMTFTSFWLEYHLFGAVPEIYHRDNIWLHADNALLLWLILYELQVPAAWFIAAAWAVHPVNVETVAWVSERKNVLSVFFYLLAALVYLPFVVCAESPHPNPLPGYRERGEDPHPGPPPEYQGRGKNGTSCGRGSIFRYLLALFFFVFALLSKTVTSTFPAAMLLLIWWKRGIRWRDVWRVVPFVLLALPMSYVTSHIEHTTVGARGPEFAFTWLQRIFLAAHDAWFYVAKDIWPVNLSFMYAKWPLTNFQFLFVGAWVFVLAVLLILQKRIGRGPLTALLFFLGTLVPALGFVSVYPMRFSYVADHFQYLASIGMIALVVLLIRRTGRWTQMASGSMLASVVLAMLALLTYFRAQAFADAITLWSDTEAKTPDSWMVCNNLGSALMDRGQAELELGSVYPAARDFSAAQLQFQHAEQLKGDITEPLTNLARIEELQGHFEQAEMYLRKALAIYPSADVHFHMGAVLVKEGKIDEGIAQYGRAIALDPGHVPAWVNLGVVLDARGEHEKAIDAYNHALGVDQNSVLARTNLGNSLLELGKKQEAAQEFSKALAIEPGFAPAERGLEAAGR